MKDSLKKCKNCIYGVSDPDVLTEGTIYMGCNANFMNPTSYYNKKGDCNKYTPKIRVKALNLLKAILHGLFAIFSPDTYPDIIKLNKEQNHGT